MKMNDYSIPYLIKNNFVLYFCTKKKNGREWEKKIFLINDDYF